MPRAEFLSQDLKVFLSEDEVWHLNHLEINDNTLIHTPFTFKCSDRGQELVVKIQKVDFEDLGDGITLERTAEGFYIRLNDSAWERLFEEQMIGTRYNGEDKVTLFSE